MTGRYVQLATEMEDLGLVAESEARARAQAHANEFKVTVWARDEFSDEPLYSIEPAVSPAKNFGDSIRLVGADRS
jgi:hypothetical protein